MSTEHPDEVVTTSDLFSGKSGFEYRHEWRLFCDVPRFLQVHTASVATAVYAGLFFGRYYMHVTTVIHGVFVIKNPH